MENHQNISVMTSESELLVVEHAMPIYKSKLSNIHYFFLNTDKTDTGVQLINNLTSAPLYIETT